MGKNTVQTQWNSPNYTPNASVSVVFGRPRAIDYITIHWWGDPNNHPTYEGVVAWLCNPRSQVSAHDVITGTGRRVAILVNYNDAGWHTGNPTGNAISLGFECDPRCRQEDYEAAAEDIADTWKYYGRIIPPRPHKSWTNTACPGHYDLNRLHQMALALYNGQTKKTATVDEVKQAYRDILEREADANGLNTYTTNGMSNAEVRADLEVSQEKRDLEARKAAEAAKKEWIRNIAPYVEGDMGYSQTSKLIVNLAEGVKVLNLETDQPVNNTIIPKGTVVDIAAKTSVKGVNYLISRFSKDKGMAYGIPESAMVLYTKPPEEEKPEWLKNLQDISDQDFYTRPKTPVLRLEDGEVLSTLPINTVVRITHATQVVGINLLVLEGEKEAIETIYLSDKPIDHPDSDLQERMSALEKIVNAIAGFLTSMFKNFRI